VEKYNRVVKYHYYGNKHSYLIIWWWLPDMTQNAAQTSIKQVVELEEQRISGVWHLHKCLMKLKFSGVSMNVKVSSFFVLVNNISILIILPFIYYSQIFVEVMANEMKLRAISFQATSLNTTWRASITAD